MMTPTSAAEAVANGAQLLDERLPGWWRRIDLTELDLSSCERCVCGQLVRSVVMDTPFRNWLRSFSDEYGFDVSEFEDEFPWGYDELDEEWKKVIRVRLEADALHQSEQREEVYA